LTDSAAGTYIQHFVQYSSVAEPGVFPSRIPDQNFSIPKPGSASKNLNILTKKMASKLSYTGCGR
jgi:hypothetical protein